MDLKAIENSLKTDRPPQCDIAICSECGWRGLVSDCEMEEEGSYEEGYFEAPVCPKCEDGGCLDNYDYSPEQFKLFKEWEKRSLGDK